MPIIHPWQDAGTGASFGTAITVIGAFEGNSRDPLARIFAATYVGVSQYSLGCQPIASVVVDVTGSAFMNAFMSGLHERAENYLAGMLEYSGGQIV